MTHAELVRLLSDSHPDITYTPGTNNYWSPEDKTVYYYDNGKPEALWTLLHETSHGLLEHTRYTSDFHLVRLEVEAWGRATQLARNFELEIDEDYLQDCLDSYRDWQYRRSLCPDCDLGGVQRNSTTYICLFCSKTWHVSKSRFCRPYRRKV